MNICQFVLKILSGNKILALIKGQNSGTNMRKMMCKDPRLDLFNVNMNPYINVGEILSIGFKDIEQTPNFGVNQGP